MRSVDAKGMWPTPGTHRPGRARTPRSVGLLVALACAVIVMTAAGATPARAATPPTGFFGLGGWSYPTDAQATALGAAGLRSYRAGLVWNDVERQQGTRNWSDVDRLMTNASRTGADVLLVLNGCAQWACGATRVAPQPGPQLDAFDAFVTAAVQRYGHGGSFWASHPALAARTVSWQVWNEVNVGSDWPNPTAAAYASFLASVGGTIKAADPRSTVVASGLTEYPGDGSGVPGAQFLDQLYAQPGFAASFDVAAAHAYAADTAGSVRVLDAMRKVMVAHGDAARLLWVTEMGWADAGPGHPFARDAAGQAAELRQAFDTLLGCRARWNLDRAMWFSVQDARPASLGEPDYWGMHTGLLTTDGSPKPAYDAFKEYVSGQALPGGGGDSCSLAGGTAPDLTTPDTAITSSPQLVGDRQRAAVSFGANKAVARFECSLDSGGWQPCVTSAAIPTTREGAHEIFVRAVDEQGIADPTPARATWMVDLSPPDTRLVSRPATVAKASVVALSFKGVDAVGVRSFECRADAGAWRACASPYRSPTLKVGRHQLGVRAIDLAGNVQLHPTVVTYTRGASKKIGVGCLKATARSKRSNAARSCTKAAACAKKTSRRRTTAPVRGASSAARRRSCLASSPRRGVRLHS